MVQRVPQAGNRVRAAIYVEPNAKGETMGAMQRRKGHAFERWVGKKFRKIFPEARRQLEFQKEVAAEGVDLVRLGRYRVQCKRMRRYSSITAIFQVKVCPIEGGCPVLVTKGDRQEAMAVLPFDELLRLIAIAELNGG